MKSIFFVGDEGWNGGVEGRSIGEKKEGGGKGEQVVAQQWENKGPMQGTMWYAHKLYTKLWMESALSRVKQ